MKKGLVIGKGVSGLAALNLLKKHGFDVEIVTTDEPFKEKEYAFVVLSPGVDRRHPYLESLPKGVEIISEVELAFRYCNCKIIAVTGTNGKSSLCTYLGVLLNAKVCGNIGDPASSVLPDIAEDEWAVLELSSFQLELMFSKKIDVAVLLNITPNHLDRHKDFQEYKEAKFRIKDLLKEGGVFLQGNDASVTSGRHFLGSAMDVIHYVVKNIGGSIEIADNLFKPLPHRMEFVRELNGVKIINDSKSTTPASTVYAVNKTKGTIVLIAGGRDKQTPFDLWNEALSSKVKCIICFGESGEKIKKTLQSNFLVYTVNKMEEAILKGLSVASKGDTLLLSPGCASFDAFKSFGDRGDVFKREVMK